MLGGSRAEVVNALSNAFLDGGALRTYRHAPNTGSRKSWAAGDATSRAVRLALMARQGEMGYPSALTAPTWGFQDVLFRGQAARPGAAPRLLRDGEYPVQDLLPGRVSRPDRGRGGVRPPPAGQGSAGRNRDHPHRDAGIRRADHRQDRAAAQPGRPGPLPAVHGRRRPAQGPPDGRGLRGRRRGRPAHRPAPRPHGREGGPPHDARTIWTRQSARSATRSRWCSGAASPPRRSRSITRSATAAAAPRGSRCCWPSSRRTSAHGSRRRRSSACWRPAPTRLEQTPVQDFVALFVV